MNQDEDTDVPLPSSLELHWVSESCRFVYLSFLSLLSPCFMLWNSAWRFRKFPVVQSLFLFLFVCFQAFSLLCLLLCHPWILWSATRISFQTKSSHSLLRKRMRLCSVFLLLLRLPWYSHGFSLLSFDSGKKLFSSCNLHLIKTGLGIRFLFFTRKDGVSGVCKGLWEEEEGGKDREKDTQRKNKKRHAIHFLCIFMERGMERRADTSSVLTK